jgi:DNA modification methylase
MERYMLTKKYLEISPAKLRPNPANVRAHSKPQIAELTSAIRQFGFINPVVVDRDYSVLAGHARLQAAKQLGLRCVPVIVVSGLSEAKRRAFVLFDNKISEKAGWDRGALAQELNDLSSLLSEEGLDIGLTGFETPEIDRLMGDLTDPEHDPAEDFPQAQAGQEAVSQRGDLWSLDRHRILCGDATQETSFRTLMRRDRASMVFTDPPYNLPVASVQGRGKIRHRDFVQGSGELSPRAFTSFLRQSLSLAAKSSVPGSLHFVFMDWRHTREILAAGDNVYNELLNLVVWTKTNGGLGSLYRSSHELIFVFKYGSMPHLNNVELGRHGRNRSNVWTYPGVNTFRAGRLDDLAIHPTVKPVALIADAIRDCTKRGNIVLEHVPPELNRQDSHGVLDRRFYRH